MSETTANNKKTAKPRGKPWPKGKSGNPAGRPKDGYSWAAIIADVGNTYPEDLIKFIGLDNDLGRNLALLPKGVQMKYLITARVFASLMFEPTAGLWKELMERVEGKVQDRLDLTSGGKTIGQDDARDEILGKLARIATATGADRLSEKPDKRRDSIPAA